MRGVEGGKSREGEYAFTAKVSYGRFWALELKELHGQDRSLYADDVVGFIPDPKTLLPGQRVLIQLDPVYCSDAAWASDVFTSKPFETRAMPTYDLVGVIERIEWDQEEIMEVKRIRFSSIERVARQQ